MTYVLHGLGQISTPAIPGVAFLSNLDQNLARLIQPFHAQLNALPLAEAVREKIKRSPLTALLDVLEPVESIFRDAVVLANQNSGLQERNVGLPNLQGRFVSLDMRPFWPSDDRLDPYTARVVQRIRLVTQIMVFWQQAPGFLLDAIAKTLVARGFNLASDGAAALRALGVPIPGLPTLPVPTLPTLPQVQFPTLPTITLPALPSIPLPWAVKGLGLMLYDDATVAAGAALQKTAEAGNATKDVAVVGGVSVTGATTVALIGLATAVVGAGESVVSAVSSTNAETSALTQAQIAGDAETQKTILEKYKTTSYVGLGAATLGIFSLLWWFRRKKS